MFCFVCAVSLLFVGLLYMKTPLLNYEHPSFQRPHDLPYDLHKYLYMAKYPFQLRIAPFCYRILQPLIVTILPFEYFTGFCIVTGLSVVVTGILMFYILKALRFHYWYCFLGMVVFFAIGFATRFNVFATWHVDAFSYVFLTLAFLFILQDRPVVTSIILAVGLLAKESVLFILPLYYTFRTERLFNPKLVFKTFIIGIPGIVILLGLRLFLPPLNNDQTYLSQIPYEVSVVHVLSDDVDTNRTHELQDLLKIIGIPRLKNITLSDLKRYSFGVWGTFILLLFIVPRENVVFLILSCPFLILVYTQILFGMNVERLLILAFPVMIPMFVTGFRGIGKKLNLHPVFLIPLPLIYFILLLLLESDYIFMPELKLQFYVMLLWFIYLFIFSDIINSYVAQKGDKNVMVKNNIKN
ncbi:hypothetical protein JW824_10740 [bacterium]|nr:hypothetical protein [bacterium]